MRLSACRRLQLGPLTGTWYRAIRQEHWETRLSARHTITVTTRFSAGSPEDPAYQVLYLAQDHQVALFEVRALGGSPEAPIPDPRITWTVLPLKVSLEAVADLTDPAEQKRIGTTAEELTGKWDQYEQSGMAPTQHLGAALFELPELEGFLVPTAVPGISGANLVVFPEKLKARSRIEVPQPEFRADRAALVLIAPARCPARDDRRAGAPIRPSPRRPDADCVTLALPFSRLRPTMPPSFRRGIQRKGMRRMEGSRTSRAGRG